MAYFGQVGDIQEGAVFSNLKEVYLAGLIVNPFKGISSGKDDNGAYGADAIVLNGGYEHDLDLGDRIIYTGDGGNRPGSLMIVENQTLTARNGALLLSKKNQLPVRVIRGSKLNSAYAPHSGCRYDGLYQVTEYFTSQTNDGHTIYQFVLDKIRGVSAAKETANRPERIETSYERIIRDTKMTKAIKRIYKDTCQVCGLRLKIGDNSYYSEGAHIRPLGKPHDGPDVIGNILCLCPNCHVQFDYYRFSINPETFELIGIPGVLAVDKQYLPISEYLQYHLSQYEHNRKIIDLDII